MPATPARIGFITKQYRLGKAGPDSTVVARHGALARATDPDEPVESFFVSADDAQAMATERLNLMSPDRRRWSTSATEAGDFALALDSSQRLPAAQLIDPVGLADMPVAIVSTKVDLATGIATFGAWG